MAVKERSELHELINKSMSFAADIWKNAMVTDCLVLKDKKRFPGSEMPGRVFWAKETFRVSRRDLLLSLCLFSCTHKCNIYTRWLLDYLIVKAFVSETEEETERERTSQRVCVEDESEGLPIASFHPLPPWPYPSPGLMPCQEQAVLHYGVIHEISHCQAWTVY